MVFLKKNITFSYMHQGKVEKLPLFSNMSGI